MVSVSGLGFLYFWKVLNDFASVLPPMGYKRETVGFGKSHII